MFLDIRKSFIKQLKRIFAVQPFSLYLHHHIGVIRRREVKVGPNRSKLLFVLAEDISDFWSNTVDMNVELILTSVMKRIHSKPDHISCQVSFNRFVDKGSGAPRGLEVVLSPGLEELFVLNTRYSSSWN